jgi:hypothetical protein
MSPPLVSAQLLKLQMLMLSGNHFSEINNESFAQFPNLAMLYLDNCSITYVQSDASSQHKSLKWIWLNQNPLEFDPEEAPFEQHNDRQMEFLDLSYTGISSAIELFSGGLSKVNKLALCGNPITELPDQRKLSLLEKNSFVYLLTELNMSDCSLESFSPTSLKYAISLSIVDFRRNKLVEFEPFDVSLWLTALTYDVLLDDNPVECTCRMKWLKYNHHYKLNYCRHSVHQEFVELPTLPGEEFLCKLQDGCWVAKNLKCACYTDDQMNVGKPVLLTCSNKNANSFPAGLPASVSFAYFD